MPLLRVPLDHAKDHGYAVGAVVSNLVMVTKAIGVAVAKESPVGARIQPEVRALPVAP